QGRRAPPAAAGRREPVSGTHAAPAANATVRSELRASLVALGWTPRPDPALAAKPYATAVGEKLATADLAAWPDGGLSLQGSYESEGRNVVAPCFQLLQATTVAAAAVRFDSGVDAAVHASYARRLHLTR